MVGQHGGAAKRAVSVNKPRSHGLMRDLRVLAVISPKKKRSNEFNWPVRAALRCSQPRLGRVRDARYFPCVPEILSFALSRSQPGRVKYLAATAATDLFPSVLSSMSVTVVLGAQWGDEGKGKLADILAHESHLCCRAQGGNNAGHTIVANGITYDFHILPSGLVNPACINVIGSGCVVHVPSFFKELEALEKHGLKTEGRIFISDRAHVVFDVHQLVDGLEEVELGGSFIGEAYADEAQSRMEC